MICHLFTFSLSLGDYITVQIVGRTQLIGNLVYVAQRLSADTATGSRV